MNCCTFTVPDTTLPPTHVVYTPPINPGVQPVVSPAQPSTPCPLPWTTVAPQPPPPGMVGDWVVVGACPKCGMPIYARPQPFSPTSSCMIPPGLPETRRSCNCKAER